MKTLLIDVDSSIPNLALMRLARFYGNVELLRLNLPYYPYKRKVHHYIDNFGYDNVFASVIFSGNREFISGEGIQFGGTGVDLVTSLPADIEKLEPDYSIYPENDISYGFITRGCIRKCPFCVVPKKEGYIHQVASVSDIVRHKKVKFLDNNILAFPGHVSILEELRDKQIKCQFNPGLDVRLVDEVNSPLLRDLNYMGEYYFAFDNWKYRKIIESKLELLSWRKPWQLKFFTYIHPDMPLEDTILRLKFLKDNRCLPYVMRDISCWDAPYKDFYTDITAWANQPNLFKKMDFIPFLDKRHTKSERIMSSKLLWQST